MHYSIDFDMLVMGKEAVQIIAKLVIPLAKMPVYTPAIQHGLETGIQSKFHATKPTILAHPSPFFQNLVAYMTVPSLLGDEFHNNVALIKSFAEFTYDITGNIMYWKLIPRVLHPFFISYFQSADKHRQAVFEHVIPVVHERREKIRQAKEAGVDHELEDTFLNGLIQYPTGTDEHGNTLYATDDLIVDAVLGSAFASVHTTSLNMSFCLYWLLARPDLKAKFLEEMNRVVPGNTPIDAERLAQMKFMNNFVRESLRQSVNVVASGKKVMQDYTFSNGYQVPKGYYVKATLRELNFGDSVTRLSVEEMDPNMSKDKSATAPAKDFATFGSGRHLCPGKKALFLLDFSNDI
jgi:cytochrome P450